VLFNLLERYPDRIAAPIFITTKAGDDDDTAKAKRTALAEACRVQGILPVAEAFRTILFAPATLADNPSLVGDVLGWVDATDPRGAAAALIAMRDRKDCVALLGSIGKPALVIGADQDQAAPAENLRIIADGLPNGELCMLHGGGHLVNLEQPLGFNDAILGFLARL
jgi:pimeloyl-ACP methyl ester carboxylesterase